MQHPVVAAVRDVEVSSAVDSCVLGSAQAAGSGWTAKASGVAGVAREAASLPKHPVCHRVRGQRAVVLQNPSVGGVGDVQVAGAVHRQAERLA
jgi:hypothetical protein